MRNAWKLLSLLLVLSWVTVPALAEERYLDALGRIQVRFDSFDELKPLVCVSVSSIPEWPGAADVMAATAEPLAELYTDKFMELENKIVPDGDLRLSSLLAETSVFGNFQFRLLLGNEAVYPAIFFPLRSEHDIANQTYTVQKLPVPFSGGQEIGFQQISWGARGHWGYVTMPCVGEVLGKLSAGEMQQLLDSAAPTEPGELASVTINFESVPKGTLQITDVLAASYCEWLPYLFIQNEDGLDYMIGSNDCEEYALALSALSLYSTAIKNLRTVGEGVRQFNGRVILEPESGDLVFTATTDYMPDSALARQNQLRHEHRQTLGGFYQPDHAIFAFAEGISPRLEQQSLLVGGARVYAAAVIGAVDLDSAIEDIQSQIDALNNPPQEESEDVETDKPLLRVKETMDIVGTDSEIILQETSNDEKTLAQLEKKLEVAKTVFPVVEKTLEQTLFPSMQSDWQEMAVTIGQDASVLGAFRITNGQNLADLMELYLKYVAEGDIISNPDSSLTTLKAHEETYKGFRFFSVNMPIPVEKHELRIEDTLSSDEEEKYSFVETSIVCIYSVSEDASEEVQKLVTQHNAKAWEEIETIVSKNPETEHEIQKRAEYFAGQSFWGYLAVSDDVAAFLVGNFAGDPMPQLKKTIDDNESERGFPETVLVFSMPTLEQLQHLMGLHIDNCFNEISAEDLESMGIDWPEGKLNIRSTLTETSRTDRMQINRDLLVTAAKAYFENSGMTIKLNKDNECEEPEN